MVYGKECDFQALSAAEFDSGGVSLAVGFKKMCNFNIVDCQTSSCNFICRRMICVPNCGRHLNSPEPSQKFSLFSCPACQILTFCHNRLCPILTRKVPFSVRKRCSRVQRTSSIKLSITCATIGYCGSECDRCKTKEASLC